MTEATTAVLAVNGGARSALAFLTGLWFRQLTAAPRRGPRWRSIYDCHPLEQESWQEIWVPDSQRSCPAVDTCRMPTVAGNLTANWHCRPEPDAPRAGVNFLYTGRSTNIVPMQLGPEFVDSTDQAVNLPSIGRLTGGAECVRVGTRPRQLAERYSGTVGTGASGWDARAERSMAMAA